MGSFKDTEAYKPYDYTSDGFLSPKSVAMVNARFRNKGRDGTEAVTIQAAFDAQVKAYRDAMPRIDDLYKGLPGSWDIKSTQSMAREMYDTRYDSLTEKFNLSPAEAAYVARRNVIENLKLKSTDQKQSSILVTDSSTNNTITVHMKVDGTGAMAPKATREDFEGAVAALTALRAGGLYKEQVNIHLLDDNSAMPGGLKAPGSSTVGFTFDDSDAIFIYVDRVADQIATTTSYPGYWSSSFTNVADAHKHFIAHEVGHQLTEKIYGSQNSDKIADDLDSFFNAEDSTPSSETTTIEDTGPSDVAKAILDSQSTNIDLSSWDQTGTAQGSNAGGTWTNPVTGEQVYAKYPKSQLHGENERLASALYQFLGIDSTNIVSGTINGKPVTYSAYVPGVKTDFSSKVRTDPAYLKKVQQGFVADAFLANWDSTLNDNIVTNANGDPVRIDPGGALLFRAQGIHKGTAFSDAVTELDSLTSGGLNPTAVGIYGPMSLQDRVESAKVLQKLTDSNIDALVDGIITDPTYATVLKDTLKKRRAYVLGKYGLTGDEVVIRKNAHAQSNKPKGTQPVPAVSTRGSASPAENFAELFAQYIATGNAPEWFLNLLESKGYAKGKKSTIWRKNYSDSNGKALVSFLDSILAENETLNYPERSSSNYGHGTKLGSKSAHRLLRVLGINKNKPKLVDTLDTNWKKIYRGVGGSTVEGTYMDPKAMHVNFATSDTPYFSMTTMYGDGAYAASLKSEAVSYGRNSNSNDNSVIEMAVDPNAKVAFDSGYNNLLGFIRDSNQLSEYDIKNKLIQIAKEYIVNELDPGADINSRAVLDRAEQLVNDLPLKSPSNSSTSNLYALLGYDAVVTGRAGNAYMVILNRAILQIRNKDIA